MNSQGGEVVNEKGEIDAKGGYTFAEDGYKIQQGDLIKEYMTGGEFIPAGNKVGHIVGKHNVYLTLKNQGKAQGSSLEAQAKKFKTAKEFVASEKNVPVKDIDFPAKGVKENILKNEQNFVDVLKDLIEGKKPKDSRYKLEKFDKNIEIEYINGKPVVVDGAHRLVAYQQLGHYTVPVAHSKQSKKQLTDIWNKANTPKIAEAQGGRTETSIIKAKTGESNEVIYDFDKNTLNGEPMSLEKYQKVKENTIRTAKERGHTLEFVSKDGNKAQGGKYE